MWNHSCLYTCKWILYFSNINSWTWLWHLSSSLMNELNKVCNMFIFTPAWEPQFYFFPFFEKVSFDQVIFLCRNNPGQVSVFGGVSSWCGQWWHWWYYSLPIISFSLHYLKVRAPWHLERAVKIPPDFPTMVYSFLHHFLLVALFQQKIGWLSIFSVGYHWYGNKIP